jgi:flagellar biosynthesis GTPase FlhF
MKRKTKTVEKRTYSLRGAIPRFVSLVARGANFTPIAQLKYGESEQFGQDVEINRIVFTKSAFATSAQVESYLTDNAYEDFEVQDAGDTWLVAGQDSDKFEDVQPIEYEEGVMYFIGKLKVEENVEAPAAEVTASEEFAETTTKELPMLDVAAEQTPNEAVADHNEEASETTVEEEAEDESTEAIAQDDATLPPFANRPADGSKKIRKKKKEAMSEEVKPEEQTSEHQEVEEGLTTQEEVRTFTQEDVKALIEAVKADFAADIAQLKEKLEKFEQTNEEVVDSNEIVIQNSQAVNSDEILKEETEQKDEKAVKFSQNRKYDLFGLRG